MDAALTRLKRWLLRTPLGEPLRRVLHAWRRLLNLDTRRRGYRAPVASIASDGYRARLDDELALHKDYLDISALPEITGYWAHRYVRPLLEELGVDHPDRFAAKYLYESAVRCQTDHPVFASLGAGNCDVEIGIAKTLIDVYGLDRFRFECLEINPAMRERGRALAEREGLSGRVVPVEADLNSDDWASGRRYHGVLANQFLHHVVELEALLDRVRDALHEDAAFVVHDMIGRNGHMRWPEALEAVQRFWAELPLRYRYNNQLQRREKSFLNWDCSQIGFEGIRAQDILPLLIERFHFEVFIGYGNVVDVFVDRSFGHNFDAEAEWDREFIDRVHAYDEQGFRNGSLTPTRMIASLRKNPVSSPHFARGLTPKASVRWPERRPDHMA